MTSPAKEENSTGDVEESRQAVAPSKRRASVGDEASPEKRTKLQGAEEVNKSTVEGHASVEQPTADDSVVAASAEVDAVATTSAQTSEPDAPVKDESTVSLLEPSGREPTEHDASSDTADGTVANGKASASRQADGEHTEKAESAETQKMKEEAVPERPLEEVKPEVSLAYGGDGGKAKESHRKRERPISEEALRETKTRGKRMFGFLQKTLAKAVTETEKEKSVDALTRRKKLEERVARRNKERAEEEEKARLQQRLKDVTDKIEALEVEITMTEGVYKARHRAKETASHYLCANAPKKREKAKKDVLSEEFEPQLPHVMASRTNQSKPIYYLPKKLTVSQQRAIDSQVMDVKLAIEKDWAQWLVRKDTMLQDLADLKQQRDEMAGHADVEPQAEPENKDEAIESEATQQNTSSGLPSA